MRLLFMTLIIFTFFIATVLPFQQDVVDVTQFETLQVLGFGQINNVAIHPDNHIVAIASEQGLFLHRLPELTQRLTFLHLEFAGDAVWSKDGSLLAAGCGAKICFWQISFENDDIHYEKVLEIDEYGEFIEWSPDERYLVIGTSRRIPAAGGEGHLSVWELSDREFSFNARQIFHVSNRDETPINHHDGIMEFAWSPDSRRFITGSWEGRVLLWTIADNSVVTGEIFSDSRYRKRAISWSPDGQYITITRPNPQGDAEALDIWDINKREVVRSLAIEGYHSQPFYYAHWSSDGTKLVTFDYENHFLIWNPQSGELLEQADLSDIYIYDWSPDEHYLITGQVINSLILRETATWQEISHFPSHGEFANGTGSHNGIWLSDNRILSTASSGLPGLYLWDIQTGSLLDYVYLAEKMAFPDIAFSPQQDFFAVSATGENSPMAIWNLDITSENHLKINQIMSLNTELTSPAWSPDGHYLATLKTTDADGSGSPENQEIEIWAVHPDGTAEFFMTLPYEDKRVWTMAWSPDSRYLAIAEPKKVTLWDIQNGQAVWTKEDLFYYSTAITWSPDGQYLAVFTNDYYGGGYWLFIRDAKSGQLLHKIEDEAPLSGGTDVAAWSPDGQYLATGYGGAVIQIMDTLTWQPRILLTGHHNYSGDGSASGRVVVLKWSPDGTQLLSFSTDDTIHIRGIPDR